MPSARCSYGSCKNDKRWTKNNVKFIRFPSVRLEREKCERWIKACGRLDFTMKVVNSRYSNFQPKRFYMCTAHFVGGNGPSKAYPDPIPNKNAVTTINGRRRDVEEKTIIIQNEDSEVLGGIHNLLVIQNLPKFTENLVAISSVNEEEPMQVLENEIIMSDVNNVEPTQVSENQIIKTEVNNEEQSDVLENEIITSDVTNVEPSQVSENLIIKIEVINEEQTKVLENEIITSEENNEEPTQDSEIQIKTEINFEETIHTPAVYQQLTFNEQQEKTFEEIITLLDIEQKVVCPKAWVKMPSPSKLDLMKIGLDDTIVVVKLSIDNAFGTSLKALNIVLDETHEIHEFIPKMIKSYEELNQTLKTIDKWKICCGNPDDNLMLEFASKVRTNGYVCPYTNGVKSNNCATIFYPKTVSKSVRCKHCLVYRYTLYNAVFVRKRKDARTSTIKPRLNYDSMLRKDLIMKMKEVKKLEVKLKRKMLTIEKKLNQHNEEEASLKLDKSESL